MDASTCWNSKATAFWAFVFAINLPSPACLAWLLYDNPYGPNYDPWVLAGIAIACGMLFAIGFYFAGRSHRIMKRISVGGLILAIFQFLPLIQCTAGCCGYGIWDKIAPLIGFESLDGHHFLEGYVLAFFVGQCLLLVSLGFGYWFEVSHRSKR